jgi:hypothetical protein
VPWLEKAGSSDLFQVGHPAPAPAAEFGSRFAFAQQRATDPARELDASPLGFRIANGATTHAEPGEVNQFRVIRPFTRPLDHQGRAFPAEPSTNAAAPQEPPVHRSLP